MVMPLRRGFLYYWSAKIKVKLIICFSFESKAALSKCECKLHIIFSLKMCSYFKNAVLLLKFVKNLFIKIPITWPPKADPPKPPPELCVFDCEPNGEVAWFPPPPNKPDFGAFFLKSFDVILKHWFIFSKTKWALNFRPYNLSLNFWLRFFYCTWKTFSALTLSNKILNTETEITPNIILNSHKL